MTENHSQQLKWESEVRHQFSPHPAGCWKPIEGTFVCHSTGENEDFTAVYDSESHLFDFLKTKDSSGHSCALPQSWQQRLQPQGASMVFWPHCFSPAPALSKLPSHFSCQSQMFLLPLSREFMLFIFLKSPNKPTVFPYIFLSYPSCRKKKPFCLHFLIEHVNRILKWKSF